MFIYFDFFTLGLKFEVEHCLANMSMTLELFGYGKLAKRELSAMWRIYDQMD